LDHQEEGVSNVEYVVGSALELPFPDHHFDGVVMSDVIGSLRLDSCCCVVDSK
jgi:ubiquinone/menaquinone biosynthesis C-methylase UbiE